MASATDMNIILGQGTAIKKVHNVKKQSLELNQHVVAQKTEDQKKEDKVKVQKFEDSSKIEKESDEEKSRKKDQQDNKKGACAQESENEFKMSEGNLIDITV
ncbi:MAG: hypothetical protein ISS67_07965 [Desulfobacterales bacterium]|nr:hypothetical protein [Desulfobacterales bacterium]MBL7208432.1 hypothetical protein [Desulfobacterales bacterium]